MRLVGRKQYLLQVPPMVQEAGFPAVQVVAAMCFGVSDEAAQLPERRQSIQLRSPTSLCYCYELMNILLIAQLLVTQDGIMGLYGRLQHVLLCAWMKTVADDRFWFVVDAESRNDWVDRQSMTAFPKRRQKRSLTQFRPFSPRHNVSWFTAGCIERPLSQTNEDVGCKEARLLRRAESGTHGV
jgi:hypothetical protein